MVNKLAKSFFLICLLSCILLFSFLTGKNVQIRYKHTVGDTVDLETNDETKYILRWNNGGNSLDYMGNGRKAFVDNKCPINNCFVTGDRKHLNDYTEFDAIVFYGPTVIHMDKHNLPQRRSPRQKYIFGTFESSDYYPACLPVLDGFFNWTWTYKLNSDARWGYVVVRDFEGNIIGPKMDMQWLDNIGPIDDTLKNRLSTKTKAAAWFVSNCHSRSGRENFVKEVDHHLKKFNLGVDIYGSCGKLRCPRDDMEKCLDMLERDYFFYFSFENSFSEDYVTEKLLHALEHNTVPVVFGGANYSRFMPDGIYLNAIELGPEKLAKTIHEVMIDPDRYHRFFRYKYHYSFHRRMESIETNDYCNICAMLHDEELFHTKSVYDKFREWWNPKSHVRC